MQSDQKAIFRFWRDIEIFHLPDLPADTKAYIPGSKLPWELPYEKTTASVKWYHTVFLGKASKQKITESIENAIEYIPAEEEDWVEKIAGNSCLAVMIIDQDGLCHIDNGYLQASYLHGLLCLRNDQPLSLINDMLAAEQEAFKERYPLDLEAKRIEDLFTPVINWSHLVNEMNVLQNLQIGNLEWKPTFFIKSFPLSIFAKPDTAFLNSFYLKDLNNLIDNDKDCGIGLDKFSTFNISNLRRTDVLEDIDSFWKALNPKDIPAGRWPSKPKQGLYAGQLGAVTTCISTLREHNGLMGVNGPPGTGKTTLLNEIIAEIIVSRAKKLIANGNKPLFGNHQKVDRSDFTFYHYKVNKDVFSDAGIVVASNNNSAVENISKELPSIDKIDLEHFPHAGYFIDHAQALISKQSWGVIAAALGNSENKQAFKSNFWFPDGQDRMGFNKYLTLQYAVDNDQTEDHRESFDKAAMELKILLGQFEKFQKDTSHFHGLLQQYLKDIESLPKEQAELNECKMRITELKRQQHVLDLEHKKLSGHISSVQTSLLLHNNGKPGWFFIQKLFKTKSFKSWNEAKMNFLSNLAENTSKLTKIQQEQDNLVVKLSSEKELENRKIASMNAINSRLDAYQKLKLQLHKSYELPLVNIPDEHLFKYFFHDKDTFHKSNPWCSEKVNLLRSNIFLLSLQLHEFSILSNAKSFRNNLGLFMEYLDGKVTVTSETAGNLWKTFFFCVPVVSTTLASVSRLFQSMDKESIGWLLIDEAGQATPQSAAGIINRSQRSIIIGDPKQIEPVTSTNSKLVKMLSKIHKVDQLWSPLQNSTQTLADRVSVSGAWIGAGEDNAIWTGFPLRTHRRCNDPMFSVANQIAYEGQMVKALSDIPFECPIGNSAWFHVAGTQVENKHVIIEEMQILKEKVNGLRNTTSEIFIISPFKSVADKCSDLFRGYTNVKCGTIHTFQGKEADIVFLVLGSDPAKPGARAWASKKPNMLNVALTRAKKRIFIIGNVNLWKDCKHFNILAKTINVIN